MFDLLSFWWLGDTKFGQSIVSALQLKGVDRNHENGIDRLRIYYVTKKGRKYTIESSGKDSPYGKYIKENRNQITIDTFLDYKNKISQWENSTYTRISQDNIKQIELLSQTKNAKEISKELNLKYATVYSVVKRLKQQPKVVEITDERFYKALIMIHTLKGCSEEESVERSKKIISLMQ